jgi:uncharacterized membrane protein YphA (DoxX/SURF4 family)
MMVQKNDWSLLILRVILGITFLIHGMAKFQMGLANVAGWFESIGILGFLGYVVAFIELFGGIALILGLGTRIISALIAFVMLGAIFTTKLAAGFMGDGQMAGYELDVALLTMAVVLVINGSQLFALDKKLFGTEKEDTDKKASV